MRGFTLIELMTVIALIMILSVVGIGTYTQATVKSKDTQRKNDINQMVKAAESFYNDVGRYPLSITGQEYMHCYTVSNGVTNNPTCDGNKLYTFIEGAITNYINIPEDPEPNYKYVYISEDGATFEFYAALENTGDRDLIKDANGEVINYPVSCGAPCNYKVTESGLVK